MAGSLKGEVCLTFEGKQLTLVLDFNALCAFEGEVGENAQTRLALLEKGEGGFTDMRALLWAMLQTHHSDMTLIDAGRVIGTNMGAIKTAFEDAFETALPPAEPAPVKKVKAASKTKTAKALRGR